MHRQSDNTLHWVLGGVTPTDLLEARQEEEHNQARERERVWYVACTRARDMLILPHLSEASTRSWSRAVDLGHVRLPEIRLKDLPKSKPPTQAPLENEQTPEVFAAQAVQVARASPDIEWKRPSDEDQDRAENFEIAPGETAGPLDAPVPLAGGRLRGILLHKLMEEFLTGELAEDEASVRDRARVLLGELVGVQGLADGTAPDPDEAARTALSTLRLPDVASLRAGMMRRDSGLGFASGRLACWPEGRRRGDRRRRNDHRRLRLEERCRPELRRPDAARRPTVRLSRRNRRPARRGRLHDFGRDGLGATAGLMTGARRRGCTCGVFPRFVFSLGRWPRGAHLNSEEITVCALLDRVRPRHEVVRVPEMF